MIPSQITGVHRTFFVCFLEVNNERDYEGRR